MVTFQPAKRDEQMSSGSKDAGKAQKLAFAEPEETKGDDKAEGEARGLPTLTQGNPATATSRAAGVTTVILNSQLPNTLVPTSSVHFLPATSVIIQPPQLTGATTVVVAQQPVEVRLLKLKSSEVFFRARANSRTPTAPVHGFIPVKFGTTSIIESPCWISPG